MDSTSKRPDLIDRILRLTEPEFRELTLRVISDPARRSGVRDRADFIEYLDAHQLWPVAEGQLERYLEMTSSANRVWPDSEARLLDKDASPPVEPIEAKRSNTQLATETTGNKKIQPTISERTSSRPGQFTIVMTWLIFILVLLTAFVLSANYLGDPWLILTVFLVFLISLVILLPFIGLNIQIVKEGRWFKAYLAALEKIPGLDMLIKTLLKQVGAEDVTNDAKGRQE